MNMDPNDMVLNPDPAMSINGSKSRKAFESRSDSKSVQQIPLQKNELTSSFLTYCGELQQSHPRHQQHQQHPLHLLPHPHSPAPQGTPPKKIRYAHIMGVCIA
jgi:hypothetical protein